MAGGILAGVLIGVAALTLPTLAFADRDQDWVISHVYQVT
jgi:hypothetical protein